MKRILNSSLILLCVASLISAAPTEKTPAFRVLAFYENGGHHIAYSQKAVVWLNQLATDSNFAIDYRQNTDDFTDDFLSRYQLLIQLDFVPYGWSGKAKEAFTTYIEKGKGGWLGFHHASLLGDFDGYTMWPWFYHFMGDIKFENYIPDFASGVVHIEDSVNPVCKGIPGQFFINKEEWYSYNRSPRSNVHVLASVDESSYQPDSVKVRMGDHPVVWTNAKVKAKNVYIFMGHSPGLWDNPAYTTLVKNAIFWAAKK